MEDTSFSELPVDVYIWRTSAKSIGKFGTSSISSATTESYCRTTDPIFGLASEIEKNVATENALDINGDGGDSGVKGD